MPSLNEWFEGLTELQELESNDRIWIGRIEGGSLQSFKAQLDKLSEILPGGNLPGLRPIHNWLSELNTITEIDPTDRLWITRIENGSPVSYGAPLEDVIDAIESSVEIEGTLGGLEDVNFASPSSGDSVFYDQGNWVNRKITEEDIDTLVIDGGNF